MQLKAKYSDGEFYEAEVLQVATGGKRSKAPVKVQYKGYDETAWLPLSDLKSKALPKGVGAPKAKAKAKAKASDVNYSVLKKGDKLQAKADDGKWHPAEVSAVSKQQSRSEAPVKVHYVGWTGEGADEWLGADRLRSKALAAEAAAAKAKAEAPPARLRDRHVTIVPYFTVPEGKMEEFKKGFVDFYNGTRAGTKSCIYYGFSIEGNRVFCREGYKDADGVLAHLADVKAPLDKAVAMVGDGGLKLAVMGPKSEIEKLKPALSPLGTVFWETDSNSLWFGKRGATDDVDTHVTIVPYFTVPEGKMEAFKKGFSKFYSATLAGTKDCYYYGFATQGNEVHCREGYANAEAVLAHLSDAKAPLDKAVKMVGEGGLKLSVMGPKAELDKLREPMGPLGTEFWELDTGAMWFGRRTVQRQDMHVTIAPYFTVPDGKMEDFTKGFKDFYKGTRSGTRSCLYYGFATAGNQVHCREGYRDAEAVLVHLGDVKGPLDKAVATVGEGGLKLSVMGPKVELDKLKEAMGPLGTVFWELDEGSMWFGRGGGSSNRRDRHVTIVPYFTVPAGKMDEFKKGFVDFYKGTREGTKACIYYGFAISGNEVFCREGYQNADGVLAHLGDVKASLDKAVAIVGEGGLKLAVMGPAKELEKLKEAMGPLGTVFWELDSGALWR